MLVDDGAYKLQAMVVVNVHLKLMILDALLIVSHTPVTQCPVDVFTLLH